MKLSITKEQLVHGLSTVQNIVSSRTTLPILSNVLLRAENNNLRFTATDLDVTISSAVEANIERPGSTTLPAKKFLEVVRDLATPTIDIDIDEKNQCAIMSGASYYKIHGLGAEEFPQMPNINENRKITIPQDKLKALLRKVTFAISNDESRFVLNGVFFSMKDHNLTLVATDGRRLALAEEEVDLPPASQGECIVPSKAINEINRLLQPGKDVEIRFADNQVAFTLAGEKDLSTIVISKLIEGNYPNFRQVIPSETKERIPLAREEFLQALRRAQHMTSDKSNSVKLSFGKNKLEITANTPEVGEGRESMAVNYKGNDIAIAFNPVYLMDPLKALDEDEVYFELNDELSPGTIKINSPFIYVLMPMRMG